MDDPAVPARVHKKYQGAMENDGGASVPCATCHSALLTRRPAFTRLDPNGFYQPDRSLAEVELEEEGVCYVLPPGRTADSLPSCDTFQPGDDVCCFSEDATDVNAWEQQSCLPGEAACEGRYEGETFRGPREYAELLLDQELDTTFYECQTKRFYAFALGEEPGTVALAANQGTFPQVSPAIVKKYQSTFAHESWNARALLRALFLGDEFLRAQKMDP
jgi:hypothetical protein